MSDRDLIERQIDGWLGELADLDNSILMLPPGSRYRAGYEDRAREIGRKIDAAMALIAAAPALDDDPFAIPQPAPIERAA